MLETSHINVRCALNSSTTRLIYGDTCAFTPERNHFPARYAVRDLSAKTGWWSMRTRTRRRLLELRLLWYTQVYLLRTQVYLLHTMDYPLRVLLLPSCDNNNNIITKQPLLFGNRISCSMAGSVAYCWWYMSTVFWLPDNKILRISSIDKNNFTSTMKVRSKIWKWYVNA